MSQETGGRGARRGGPRRAGPVGRGDATRAARRPQDSAERPRGAMQAGVAGECERRGSRSAANSGHERRGRRGAASRAEAASRGCSISAWGRRGGRGGTRTRSGSSRRSAGRRWRPRGGTRPRAGPRRDLPAAAADVALDLDGADAAVAEHLHGEDDHPLDLTVRGGGAGAHRHRDGGGRLPDPCGQRRGAGGQEAGEGPSDAATCGAQSIWNSYS